MESVRQEYWSGVPLPSPLRMCRGSKEKAGGQGQEGKGPWRRSLEALPRALPRRATQRGVSQGSMVLQWKMGYSRGDTCAERRRPRWGRWGALQEQSTWVREKLRSCPSVGGLAPVETGHWSFLKGAKLVTDIETWGHSYTAAGGCDSRAMSAVGMRKTAAFGETCSLGCWYTLFFL